jgi:hypothetical protein
VLLKADINYVTILGQKLWHATDNVKNRLWKKPHFICSFSKNVFFGYRIAVDATAAWAQGQISKPPKMLLKLVMSISYETRSIQI